MNGKIICIECEVNDKKLGTQIEDYDESDKIKSEYNLGNVKKEEEQIEYNNESMKIKFECVQGNGH